MWKLDQWRGTHFHNVLHVSMPILSLVSTLRTSCMPLTQEITYEVEPLTDMHGISELAAFGKNSLIIGSVLLKRMRTEFQASPKNILAMNAGCRNEIKDIILSRQRPIDTFNVFSHRLSQEAKATNQKSSGRCWLFAALNVLRLDVIKRYNLGDDFEFSQNYLAWHDKLEKSNWFLDNIVRTADEPLDGRITQFLLQSPVQDGGQWDMAVNLIEKYGLVPKNVFPETANSGSTAQINNLLTRKLREWASVLRNMVHLHGASSQKIADAKCDMMVQVYRILSIALGEPNFTFDWSFRDKDKKFISFKNLTPQTFYNDHVKKRVSNMVSLVHDPRNQYNALYTVEYLGNVVGGRPVLYLNLPIEELKNYALQTLIKNFKSNSSSLEAALPNLSLGSKNSNESSGSSVEEQDISGSPVWFGCDMGKFVDRVGGVMDIKYFDYGTAFDLSFELSKSDSLRYGDGAMSHAMAFTGVHLENEGQPIRWRVENSWGETHGEKGYFTMSDEWFNEHVYQVVVDKDLLSPELLVLMESGEVQALPPWDPLGALA